MSDDPRQGDSLSDMAPTGTSIPEDAGTQRVIPSVPRPDNVTGTGIPDTEPTNATDIPRSTLDAASTGEVQSAAGGAMPSTMETKRLAMQSGDTANAKGDLRRETHINSKGPQESKLASDGPAVEPAPGEEEESQETLQERRDGV